MKNKQTLSAVISILIAIFLLLSSCSVPSAAPEITGEIEEGTLVVWLSPKLTSEYQYDLTRAEGSYQTLMLIDPRKLRI